MKARRVRYTGDAEGDLRDIFDWLDEATGRETAMGYVSRITDFCETLSYAAERGTLRKDLPPGVRAIGFRHSATVVFRVDGDQVTILGIFRKGRNWTADFGR
ncbi:type II toxin-antitoxin system RelE/ParE family toxin [Zavarzinia sp. CC-PAN008]|uniref:type II toxin-antitoxin system RelE/ParE family toxin n=1 Tax=Zavarzinia sp. CC-PAN008 TaxID=3243332 RepID=UPI003F742210